MRRRHSSPTCNSSSIASHRTDGSTGCRKRFCVAWPPECPTRIRDRGVGLQHGRSGQPPGRGLFVSLKWLQDIEGPGIPVLDDLSDPRLKIFTVARLLRFRRDHAVLFAEGDYQPILAEGEFANHVFCFLRTRGSAAALCVVPRSHLDLGSFEVPADAVRCGGKRCFQFPRCPQAGRGRTSSREHRPSSRISLECRESPRIIPGRGLGPARRRRSGTMTPRIRLW